MSDEIMLVFGEDGVAREYDDTWDITIHCESEEEQKAVLEKIKNSNQEAKAQLYAEGTTSDLISRQDAIETVGDWMIKEYGYLLKNPIELLHFAPEAPFYKNFSNMENIDYYPVDINSDKYARRNTPIRDEVNIENIPYDNEKFDSIICAHVLEHVTDYMKSMNELYRVLKKDGVCFVSVPLSGNYETLENPEYNTPELRLKHYYQEDHLRLFGFDIKEKLESVGFNVKQYTIDDLINDEKYKEIYGLKSKFNYFVCTKE